MLKRIKESPKKMYVPVSMVEMATVPKNITLDNLANMEVFQKVTINVKVVGVKPTC